MYFYLTLQINLLIFVYFLQAPTNQIIFVYYYKSLKKFYIIFSKQLYFNFMFGNE